MALSLREFAYWMTRYRHTWRANAVFTLANPLLFLLGMGVGLGKLVDSGGHPPQAGVSYLAFVAPGLLAASSMQIAFAESSQGVYSALRTQHSYRIAAASPLEPEHILAGHLLFVAFRLVTTGVVFAVTAAVLGAAAPGAALCTVPAAVLTGLAFAAPTAAWAVTVRRSATLSAAFRFLVLPLYLFSGTFFAADRLPRGVRQVAQVTPLWQGVQLCRDVSLRAAVGPGAALHVLYLAALTAAGLWAARRTYRRELHG